MIPWPSKGIFRRDINLSNYASQKYAKVCLDFYTVNSNALFMFSEIFLKHVVITNEYQGLLMSLAFIASSDLDLEPHTLIGWFHV